MNLTPHFTLEELVNSDTATRLGIDNTPSEEVIENLKFLAEELEYVRSLLGHPMLISSGFRCHALNDHLGSKRTSSHTKGLAVDYICPGFGDPRSIVSAIVMANINYDQVILEYDRWVHLSFKQIDPRHQALIIDKEGVRPFEDTTT
ncbi:peptidase M15A [Methylophilales phage HIM624-A]|nr:peptidase M15A [Methylophilales phage HIM624-A]